MIRTRKIGTTTTILIVDTQILSVRSAKNQETSVTTTASHSDTKHEQEKTYHREDTSVHETGQDSRGPCPSHRQKIRVRGNIRL